MYFDFAVDLRQSMPRISLEVDAYQISVHKDAEFACIHYPLEVRRKQTEALACMHLPVFTTANTLTKQNQITLQGMCNLE